MPELFLGVDAGGTKTHAGVMDASGRLLGLGVAPTGNWERVGVAGTVFALSTAIDDALAQFGRRRADITSATFALAGIDWDSDASAMQEVLQGFGLGCRPLVVNDAIAVLLAGTSDGIGCASVAGTGGKTVARDASRTLSTLGMSLGEGGGAGQVVAEALAAIAEAYHGQRAPTPLTSAILELAGMPGQAEFFESVARDGYQVTESFAPTVFALAEEGDAAALEVVQRVARQHARDVVGLVDQLEFAAGPVPVVCAGGLHTAGSTAFASAFEQGLVGSRWPLQVRVLAVVPVVGALVDSVIRATGRITGAQRATLIASATALEGVEVGASSSGIALSS